MATFHYLHEFQNRIVVLVAAVLLFLQPTLQHGSYFCASIWSSWLGVSSHSLAVCSYQFSFSEEFLALSCSKSVQVFVVLRSILGIALGWHLPPAIFRIAINGTIGNCNSRVYHTLSKLQ
jgi:hypothetical protein